MTVYAQDGYAVRLEWGADGVRELAPHCAVLVIVDVLVFTTSVDVALGRGGRVLPLPWRDERAGEAARRAGAVLTRSGLSRTAEGFTVAEQATEWTLRPSSLVDLPEGTFLAIASPNGATLCAAAAELGATVLAGCLRNASAVGAAARTLARDRPIGVVPAGERWHHTEVRGLRPSLEEVLGAGAIVRALGDDANRSPEAELAALSYAAADGRVAELLAGSVSGRELAHAGVPVDVELAGRVDCSDVVPMLVDGVFERWAG
ncbi:MAG TPA: 2-phosphosulfolactate phosphatase [Actinophytocola sp.]|uniref:2-phosphosulfolactate phosphatase n=1 Tax=Actinophytocola sp. TaxID=1872138 RepID=UPI002DDD149C|nr:2-phosphosulfolactate phosphatase [Actinophytocola sp.]HEV2783818.1 2-phosphosulfolactate phosphatase [Actinophytocola sp.]